MNFKWLLFLFIAMLASCGVKGPPSPPEGTAIPSYPDRFLDTATSTQATQIKK